MSKQHDIFLKLGFSAAFLLLFGLFSWRQYLKFIDGRGIARWLLPADAPLTVQLVVFVLVPFLASLAAGWAVARDSK